MSKELGPSMPLYWDDLIGGTLSFGASEFGAYLLLLGYQWANGSVENCPKTIERIAREEYGKLGRVLRKFDVGEDGALRNARCNEIREARLEFIRKQRENAVKGGEATKSKLLLLASLPASPPASPPAGPPAGPGEVPKAGPNKALPSPSPSPIPFPLPLPKKKKHSSSAADDGFDVWWVHYPRKVGKLAAKKAWDRIPTKDRPAAAVVIEAITRLKASDQWRKDGGAFIPHPATWINRGGWMDEATIGVTGRKAGSFSED